MHSVRKPWRFVLLSPSFAAVDIQLYIFVGIERRAGGRQRSVVFFLPSFSSFTLNRPPILWLMLLARGRTRQAARGHRLDLTDEAKLNER